MTILYFLQNWLIYYPDRVLPSPSAAGVSAVEEVSFKTADGVRLFSWYTPPRHGNPTLLFFHGNAGNIAYRAARIKHAQEEGWGMLLVSYRGYGKSEGSPDEPGLYQDSRAARAWLRARPEVDTKKLVYYGESLGCAVALELAAAEPPATVVLEAPFASLKAMARLVYPWLPTSLLLRSRFDNIECARMLRSPVFIAHGRNDDVVPFQQGKDVFDAAPEPKRFYELDSHHNDILDIGGLSYRAALRDFIKATVLDRSYARDLSKS